MMLMRMPGDLDEAHEEGAMVAPSGGTIDYEAAIELRFGKVHTLQQVADALGISRRQVQAHVDDGSLVAVNVGRGVERRDLRVFEHDLEGFVARRRVGVARTTPAPGRRRRAGIDNRVEADGYAARWAERNARKGNSDVQ